MGPRYHFRLNGPTGTKMETVESMRSEGFEIGLHETIPEAAYLPVVEQTVAREGIPVLANRFAAEAVMQGAHLYSLGVESCRGLRSGTKATVQDQNGVLVGSGIARQGETDILNYHQGIAFEYQRSRFRLLLLRAYS